MEGHKGAHTAHAPPPLLTEPKQCSVLFHRYLFTQQGNLSHSTTHTVSVLDDLLGQCYIVFS